MSLEYVNIKGAGKQSPYLENGRQYNKWPTMNEQPKWMGQYPSKAPPRHWDSEGVYYYGKKGKEEIAYANDDQVPYTDKRLCDVYEPGTRWSADSEPLQPNFWSGNYTVNSTCGENYWLFNNAGNPNGTFYGGGKK